MAAEFDSYAGDYEGALGQGVRLSGEDPSFFPRGRVAWLAGGLAELGVPSRSILDFGCGTGSATPFLLELPGAERLVGTDVSLASLEVARREHASERATFVAPEAAPRGEMHVAHVNGVFHHIPPDQRSAAVAQIRAALCPGGVLAFFENNPWNPGTRMVMRRIPFDRDAETLSAPVARRLLRGGGFDVLRTDFLFVFPRALSMLRPLEPRLARAPLGAQYLVLARRR